MRAQNVIYNSSPRSYNFYVQKKYNFVHNTIILKLIKYYLHIGDKVIMSPVHHIIGKIINSNSI